MNRDTSVTAFSPFIFSKASTSAIMLDVIIALLPVCVVDLIVYGTEALRLLVICPFFCVALEALMRKIAGKPQTVSDLSAVVTGLILALNMPPSLGIGKAFLGCFTAIIVVKQLFGGIGRNFVNPALVGITVLNISYPSAMTAWTVNAKMCSATLEWTVQETLRGFTPLEIFNTGWQLPSAGQMIFSFMTGNLGDVCTAALLAGGIYLIVRKRIDPFLPLSYLAAVTLMSLLFGYDPVFHMCAGGVVLYAFFMADDYTTSPIMRSGKIIYGLGCGLLTMFIREYSVYQDGAMYALLLMNLLVPYIDMITEKRPFGAGKGGRK